MKLVCLGKSNIENSVKFAAFCRYHCSESANAATAKGGESPPPPIAMQFSVQRNSNSRKSYENIDWSTSTILTCCLSMKTTWSNGEVSCLKVYPNLLLTYPRYVVVPIINKLKFVRLDLADVSKKLSNVHISRRLKIWGLL